MDVVIAAAQSVLHAATLLVEKTVVIQKTGAYKMAKIV
jgi:hypothetical protein